MIKLILSASIGIVLAGCASSPTRLPRDQFCYTSQVIETEDKQTVNSRVRVQCTDDPVERYVPAKLGIAKDCITTYIQMLHGMERVSACKRFDGRYDIVESRTQR